MTAVRSLKSRTLTAGIWATVLGFAGTAVRFANSLVITRLLVPEVFGVVALAAAFTTVVSLLSDIGLRQYVIYSPRGNDPEVVDTIRTLSVIRGLLIAAISLVLAVAVYIGAGSDVFMERSVYTHPDLPIVLAHFGISAIVLGFKSPKLALLERELDLKSVGAVELIALLGSTVVTLALAWSWRSIWAIVAGVYVNAVITVLLSIFWVDGRIGRFTWNRQIAAEVVRYGRWILLASIAFVLASNADRLLLGNLLSAADLGFYMIALNIVQMFEQIVSKPFTAVALPALSEVARSRSAQMRSGYLKLRLPYDMATITMAGIVFAAGQFIVEFLYDPRYAAAGSILQVLSFSLLFPRFSAIGTAHAALGEPQTETWVSFCKLVSIAICIPIGHAIAGNRGAIWAIALHMIPGALVYLYRNQKHGLNNFAFEAGVLACWPVGYVIGLVGSGVATAIFF
jgi:O-antigen/teichoic acid export membrane protein